MWSLTLPWPMRMPERALGNRYGALLMLSMPPATMMSALPAMIASCASMAAFIAEPHILDSVVQLVDKGSPALIDACRAGACPWPAMRQLPKISSSTSADLIPARSTAALIATPPRSLAASVAKSPWNPPIGVRAAPTIAMGSFCKTFLLGVVDAIDRALVTSVAVLNLRTCCRRDQVPVLTPAAVPAAPLLRLRRGRRTSSALQLGQMPLSALAQVAQKVHS